MNDDICDVPGFRVGHWTDPRALTGCTVVLADEPAVVGADVRGAAPGTRETDLARPGNLVQRADAVLLSGGSAFGLDAACGVVRYLEEQGRGFDTGVARVPIVLCAVIFDLAVGDPRVRPDATSGYRACLEARTGPVMMGNVGAGSGATVGKWAGQQWCMKGGLGSASATLSSGARVGALVVVNSIGDVYDPEDGTRLAGARSSAVERPNPWGSTTIGVVATDASLDQVQAWRLAAVAHDGIALAVRPAHTMYDGDTLFTLARGTVEVGDFNELCWAAVSVVARAITKAIKSARSVDGIPAWSDQPREVN